MSERDISTSTQHTGRSKEDFHHFSSPDALSKRPAEEGTE